MDDEPKHGAHFSEETEADVSDFLYQPRPARVRSRPALWPCVFAMVTGKVPYFGMGKSEKMWRAQSRSMTRGPDRTMDGAIQAGFRVANSVV